MRVLCRLNCSLFSIVLVILFLFDVNESSAVTVYVDAGGSCSGYSPCYSIIQDAIDNSDTENVIEITQGTYNENIVFNSLKNLTISGGWDPSFTSQSASTIIQSMTIESASGTVTVGGLIIEYQTNPPGEPTREYTIGRGSYNTEGEMNYPSGITVDNDGNVYVCSDLSPSISKFDGQGNFLTRWNIQDCYGLEADKDNNIYIAIKTAHRIEKYDSSGNLLLQWGSYGTGDGQFYEVNDVAVNNMISPCDLCLNGLCPADYICPNGKDKVIYAADSRNLRIQVFDEDGIFLFKWRSEDTGGPPFGGPRGPKGIAVDQSTGDVYVADSEKNRMQKFDLDGNFLRTWGTAGVNYGEFRWPRDVEIGSDGSVYVVDTDNERIQKFDPVGNFLSEFQGLHNEIDGPFHPRGVAVDTQSGFIYATATYAQRIDAFDESINTSNPLPQPYGSENFLFSWGWWEKDNGVFNRPAGLAIDAQRGLLYVADMYNALMQKFDLSGNYLSSWGYSGRVYTTYDGGDGSFDFHHAVAADDVGNVYVLRPGTMYPGDPVVKRVQKFDGNGNFLTSWNSPDPLQIHRHRMEGIAYNPINGYLYVTNKLNNSVQRYTVSGAFIDEFGGPGNTDGKFNRPTKIAVNRSSGNIYVIDLGNMRIQEFSTDGVFLYQWGQYGTADGQFMMDIYSGIYVDDNGYVYVSDTGNKRIQVFDSDGYFVLSWQDEFHSPAGIVIDSIGHIYVVDRQRETVYKYTPIQW